MLLLVHSLHEKISPEAKTDEILKVCATYLLLHSCYNFVLVLHENAFVLSQKRVIFFVCVHYYSYYQLDYSK